MIGSNYLYLFIYLFIYCNKQYRVHQFATYKRTAVMKVILTPIEVHDLAIGFKTENTQPKKAIYLRLQLA